MRDRPKQTSTLSCHVDSVPGLVTKVTGLYAILGGLITLVGWAMRFPRFTDWAKHGISMYPNTAVCSIAGGAALLFLNAAQGRTAIRVVVCMFASLVTAVAGATVFENVTDIDLGIDELLFEGTWGQMASVKPMRMGIPASFSFLLLGGALVLAAAGRPRSRYIASAIALLPITVASLSLVGYWFGASQLYGMARYTGISWQTGTIICALGVGLVAALRECGFMAFLMRPDAGGLAARRLLLPIIVIPVIVGWITVLGNTYGIFDNAFGTALRTFWEIVFLLGFLWWTSRSISRHAAAASEANSALFDSERRFVLFMQSLPGLAWIKDTDGRYIYANDAALKAFRKSRDELYGFTDADVMPEEAAAVFMENDRLALGQPDGLQLIETLRHGDETPHSSLVSKFPIPGPEGTPKWVGGIAIDITDRLRAEEELKKAYRRKDEFIATLAHELRNPLSPIHFSVEICRSHADPAKRERALNAIDRQVRQMSRLLDDLLDASRITYGKLTLRPERVELAGIVKSAVETSHPLRDEAGQSLDIELPDEPVFLNADPVRLEQVFANLLNNAAKYGGRGSRVCLTVTTDAGMAVITISDNGAGIPKERLADVFEMFSQVKSPSNGCHGGLGIGLSLVKGIVDLHAGTIEARSEGLGTGSEFIVRIPLFPDYDGAERAGPPDTKEGVSAKAVVKPLRILIADDLRDSADSIADCFRGMDHEVRTAYDGAEALSVAENFHPDALFLDLGMPHLTGDEVCRRIRKTEWGKRAFIVAITGWGQEKDRLLTAAAGFNRHLVKPARMDELLALLADVRPERYGE